MILFLIELWASLIAQLVKNPPAMRETWVRSLGWEDPLEKETATHSSILAYTVHGVARSWTRLSDFHSLTHSLMVDLQYCQFRVHSKVTLFYIYINIYIHTHNMFYIHK